jgi:hypothetical protein
MFPSPQPSPQRGEGADRANFLWGSHRHVEEGQGESIRPHRSRLTYASFNKLRAVG